MRNLSKSVVCCQEGAGELWVALMEGSTDGGLNKCVLYSYRYLGESQRETTSTPSTSLNVSYKIVLGKLKEVTSSSGGRSISIIPSVKVRITFWKITLSQAKLHLTEVKVHEHNQNRKSENLYL